MGLFVKASVAMSTELDCAFKDCFLWAKVNVLTSDARPVVQSELELVFPQLQVTNLLHLWM